MKKKVIIMGVAAALVLCAIVGGTVAAPTAKSEKKRTEINIEDLDVALTGSIEAKYTEDNVQYFEFNDCVPGEVINLDYTVKNPGKMNKDGIEGKDDYSLYIRVVIDKKWMSGTEVDTSLSPKMLVIDTMQENWIVASDEEDYEQLVLYYREAVKPGEETKPFLKSLKLSEAMNNDYTDKSAELIITVSAVQANQNAEETLAQKAMLAEWGVYPVIEDGVITKIVSEKEE